MNLFNVASTLLIVFSTLTLIHTFLRYSINPNARKEMGNFCLLPTSLPLHTKGLLHHRIVFQILSWCNHLKFKYVYCFPICLKSSKLCQLEYDCTSFQTLMEHCNNPAPYSKDLLTLPTFLIDAIESLCQQNYIVSTVFHMSAISLIRFKPSKELSSTRPTKGRRRPPAFDAKTAWRH